MKQLFSILTLIVVVAGLCAHDSFADQPGFATSRWTLGVRGGTYWTKGGSSKRDSDSEWAPDKAAYGYAGYFSISSFGMACRTLKGRSTTVEIGFIERSKIKFMPISIYTSYHIASEGNWVIPRIGFGGTYFKPLEDAKNDAGDKVEMSLMSKIDGFITLGTLVKVCEDTYLSLDVREGLFAIFDKRYETTIVAGLEYAL